MMDLIRKGLLVLGFIFLLEFSIFVSANVVFKVQHKYGGRGRSVLGTLRAHDAHRHGRMLAAVDFPLGGNGSPTDAALYFTKLGIGTPSKEYYVQVDTGSDMLWVNCVGCAKCPKKSGLGIELKLYDPKLSSTGNVVSCNQDICSKLLNNPYLDCTVGSLCEYALTYGDGSQTGGFAVSDIVKLDQVSGNLHTTSMNGTISFGSHYNVNMKSIEVGGDILELPTDIFDSGSGRGTIIDSGTTLAYLPDEVYDPLMAKIMAQQANLKTRIEDQQFKCFYYSGNVDDGFPVVTFYFENSLALTVHPHDYMFQIRGDEWCVGWQNSGLQNKDGKELTLLGDLVLSNKLVLYDLENQTIGWTNYNCSSSIKVKDEQSGVVYTVSAQDISSACSIMKTGKILGFLLLIAILCKLII